MDISNLINLGLFLLTGLGVAVAAREARRAQQARQAADISSAGAAAHAKASLAAAERSANASELAAGEHQRIADAAERQAAVAEHSARPPEPWLFKPLGDVSVDQRWRVTNATGGHVTSVTIGTPAGENEQWIQPQNGEQPVDLTDGDSIYFTFVRRLSSPSTAVVWVFWTPADGGPQKQITKSI